jgi:alpha-amylase
VTALVLYFQVHQPFRLRRYGWFDIGRDDRWFDDGENARIFRRVASRCYLPMNALLLRMVRRGKGRFRCAFSVSGTALDQAERWAPEVLDSFRALADTGCVEFLAETSHHSLSLLGDPAEFRAQVESHRDRVERLFGARPTAFRNTELVFDDAVAREVEGMGFDAVLGEGADHLLGWRDPYAVYRPEGCRRLRLLLRAYRLSDDIAFRFSARSWAEWPLDAAKFAGWLRRVPRGARHVGLFMDYETVGEHQPRETGIFEFLDRLPAAVARSRRFRFLTPSEAARAPGPVESLSVPRPVSWADFERDLSAWLGNPMQKAAHEALYALLPAVRRTPRLLERWRRLSTSDHFYYMSTKWSSDGDVHTYFSPWGSPHDAHRTYMSVLDDLSLRAGGAAR